VNLLFEGKRGRNQNGAILFSVSCLFFGNYIDSSKSLSACLVYSSCKEEDGKFANEFKERCLINRKFIFKNYDFGIILILNGNENIFYK